MIELIEDLIVAAHVSHAVPAAKAENAEPDNDPLLVMRTSFGGDQEKNILALQMVHKSREVHATTYTWTTVRTFLLVSLFWTCWTSTSRDAAAAEINWQKYRQSSTNVSAIASAVAWVDRCSKKLIIEETITEAKVRLDFICYGTKDEDATGSIEFDRFGDEGLIPSKFLWAG